MACMSDRRSGWLLSVGVAFGVPLADGAAASGAVTRTPPPVVWEVNSRIWQVGWNGLFDPSHVWVDKQYAKTISNGVGGYAINTTSQSWNLEWDWSGGFPSAALTKGRLGPSVLSSLRALQSSWSSNFIMEDAIAQLDVTAWVRGAPGTPYVASVTHTGVWTGLLSDSGGADLYGLGAVGSTCANCSAVLGFAKSTMALVLPADGPTIEFDEFPGVVYTRAGLLVDPGVPAPIPDKSGIHHHAGESCILFCGPPSQVVGGGTMTSVYRIQLDSGFPPQGAFTTAFADGGDHRYPVGQPLNLEVAATDPDNPDGGGILDYQWSVDGEIVQFGETGSILAWAPPTVGEFHVQVEVSDDEGMWITLERDIVAIMPGDADGDGVAGPTDLAILLGSWGPCPVSGACAADFDGDGVVGAADIAILLGSWG